MDYISKAVIFIIRNTGYGFPGGFGTIRTLGVILVLKFCPQNNAQVQVEPVMTGKCASSSAHGQ